MDENIVDSDQLAPLETADLGLHGLKISISIHHVHENSSNPEQRIWGYKT